MDPLTLLIDLLAVYRLSRLITKDSLLQEVRWWILQRWPNEGTEFPDSIVVVVDPPTMPQAKTVYGRIEFTDTTVFKSNKTDAEGDPIWLPLETHKITELIECPYCASVWLAFGVMALRVWTDWWQYPAIALALAGAVALIFARLDND